MNVFWRNLVSILILKGKKKKFSPPKPISLVHFMATAHCSSGEVVTTAGNDGRRVTSTANQGAPGKMLGMSVVLISVVTYLYD